MIDQLAVPAVLPADAFSPVPFEDECDLAPEQMTKKNPLPHNRITSGLSHLISRRGVKCPADTRSNRGVGCSMSAPILGTSKPAGAVTRLRRIRRVAVSKVGQGHRLP